jgi:carbon storage regulator
MLVLNRQPGHAVLFTGGIRIVILECSKRGVRIGIEAPADVGIMREEIADRIADENVRATNMDQARALPGQEPAA